METLGNSVMGEDIHSLCALNISEDPEESIYFFPFSQETFQALVCFGGEGCMMFFRCCKLNPKIWVRNINTEIPPSLRSIFLTLV